MTPRTPPDERPDDLFIADFYPELGAYLAGRHASGYDAAGGRARFLLWLAAHVSEDDVAAIYLARAGQAPLLTADEEAGLGARIAAGRRAEDRLAEEMTAEGRAPGGAPEDAARAGLIRAAQDGARAADLLVEANLRLVVSLARRYGDRGVPLRDLIGWGNVGLMRAVHRYDPAKGYRFATFATWWIRQEITRGLADGLPRIPVQALLNQASQDQASQAESTDTLTRTERRVRQALGREPTPEELAAELDPSV